MGGGEGNTQHGRATCQHHHHLFGAGLLREVFGMAGKVDPGIVDGAFLQRRGNDGIDPACLCGFNADVERVQHAAAIAAVERAGHHQLRKRAIDDGNALAAEVRQATVAHRLQRRRNEVDGWINGVCRERQKCRIANQYTICFGTQLPCCTYGNFRSDAGRFATRDGETRPRLHACRGITCHPGGIQGRHGRATCAANPE